MKKYILLTAAMAVTLWSSAQKKGQWENLFNGKDLSGWHQLNGKANYTVENGEIVGTTVANTPNSFLCTDKLYGDFILELDLKVDPSMNSGIQIRSESTPEYRNGRVHGYQVEIDPSSRAWSGGIYDEARRDWLYPLTYNPAAQKAFKADGWNHYRVECIGSSIRTWVNGVPASNLVDNMTLKGFIALQVHAISKSDNPGKQIRWKNIRIQTGKLRPTPYDNIHVVNLIPNNLSAQEKANGIQLLWDGKTTKGWRGINRKDFPEKGWTIKDGVLTVQASNGQEEGMGGDIVTDKEYKAFELQFEFKLTKGANSGVKYFVTENYDTKGKSGIGLEYQVLDDKNHPDAKLGRNGDRTLSSLYDLIPRKITDKRALKPIGAWNDGRIVVYPDNRVEHYLNGYKVVEYVKGSPEFMQLVAISKYKDWKGFGLWKEGHILLQDHGNEVSFRSLKIKVLK
ncbi:DUF1080 domain-containing protein [Compostibacter hankyongensis]|uniref:DUF1080 domain-containing protein n=1 Tax=Compostibacter hankyongensis TaxID=1007089 RepID=A0ABP8FJ46_9BACT